MSNKNAWSYEEELAFADVNAARNILAAGHAVLSAEGGRSKGRPMKQKTSDTVRMSPKS